MLKKTKIGKGIAECINSLKNKRKLYEVQDRIEALREKL